MNFARVAVLRRATTKITGHCHGGRASIFVDRALRAPHFHETEFYKTLRESWFPVQFKPYVSWTAATSSSFLVRAYRPSNPKVFA
jgi:hypothetical protein